MIGTFVSDSVSDSLTVDQVTTLLHEVIDPEVGIGIVDLGLVYDVAVDDVAIRITMTMTTPACPLSAYLDRSVEHVLADVAATRLIEVELASIRPGALS